jgi:hypothetical protein
MGRYASRSVFAAMLCAGVAMVGASVHGLLGVDAELQRSAFAAYQHRTFEERSVPVIAPHERDRDCPGRVPVRDYKHLT